MTGDFAAKGIHLPQAVAHQEASAIVMPVLDWTMSDLDARDTQNRPLRDTASLQSLTSLFIENLFNLVVVSEHHGQAAVWSSVALFSRLFNDLIFNFAYPLWQAIPKAWAPSKKGFVHNVDNVWITL